MKEKVKGGQGKGKLFGEIGVYKNGLAICHVSNILYNLMLQMHVS